MIYSMMAAAALAAGLAPGNLSPEPTWLNDYTAAQMRVAFVKKPMAVFVGSGKDGWGKVVRDGSLDPTMKRILADKFVCVYLDTDTVAGRSLAGAFEVASRGLIISNRAGTSQAYSLSGDLTKDELARTLEKYADDKAVTGTETIIREAPPARPVVTPAPPVYYQPQYQLSPRYYPAGGT